MDRTDLARVLDDILVSFWNCYERDMYECEACGRLYLLHPDPKRGGYYLSYLPEEGQRGVLASWYHQRDSPDSPPKLPEDIVS